MIIKTYKTLDVNRKPYYGGVGRWPELGKWLEVKGKIVPCINGLHLCLREDLVYWLGPVIYEVEFKGVFQRHPHKIVVSKARLIRKVVSWNTSAKKDFAYACANHVKRLRIHTYGVAVTADAAAIAGVAVAADAAAAAIAAVAAAYAADAAADAADAAAYADAAATAATSSAASAAMFARLEERKWQTNKLFEYLES